jgi:hypothetical protein
MTAYRHGRLIEQSEQMSNGKQTEEDARDA